MGDCVECTGVRLARATVVSETVEGTGHCVEERLLVLVEHRYPRVRPVALLIRVEGRDLPCKKGLSFGQWLAADRVVGGQIIPVNREFIVEPSQCS